MADTTHSLATYVSDMLAVEKHLQQPFETQLKDSDFLEYQDTTDVVTRLSALSDQHIRTLETALDELGGHEAAGVKNAVTGFEGAVAGLIDKVRKTKVSKALRDDYAALAFAIVSYSELLATANGLGNSSVSTVAQRHLEDYAGILMELGECIPAVVVRELNEIDVDVDTSSSETTRQAIRQAWRSRAQRNIHGDIDLERDETLPASGSGTL